LVEALANELASKLLDNFPAYRVTLRVRKMKPPIPGHIDNIEIEITRDQKNTEQLLKKEMNKNRK
jgi:dihydroneopterin aldolase